MAQYINGFSSKGEQLGEAGIELPEELLSIMLLSSLPEEYENFSVQQDRTPPFESLKVKLIEEEARQNDRDQESEEEHRDETFVGKCYSCGKSGQMARECKISGKSKDQAMISVATNRETGNENWRD
ncbi:UNVERIFIED_CONTAM: hypothetical protein PYX00_007688 [Menopon gallinae]|uniref:CCHC-type domain-containing protein n=1 Tax=Menopon gallinae TaxID=328185 RepID=A0AAW2HK86_9NEOP